MTQVIDFIGGEYRNRTGVHGFAIRCVTTPPTRRSLGRSIPRSKPAQATIKRFVDVAGLVVLCQNPTIESEQKSFVWPTTLPDGP